MSNLDELNGLITEVIRRAEELEDVGSPYVKTAYAEVSRVEEKIAGVTEPTSVEGMIARRGAVRAAIKADDPGRARLLADRFVTELDTVAQSIPKWKDELNALLP